MHMEKLSRAICCWFFDAAATENLRDALLYLTTERGIKIIFSESSGVSLSLSLFLNMGHKRVSYWLWGLWSQVSSKYDIIFRIKTSITVDVKKIEKIFTKLAERIEWINKNEFSVNHSLGSSHRWIVYNNWLKLVHDVINFVFRELCIQWKDSEKKSVQSEKTLNDWI